MTGRASIRYELRACPLARAISPGRGGAVEEEHVVSWAFASVLFLTKL